MKDKQGIVRGKCNSCECQEYIAPSGDSESGKPLKVRCDYCNHTPVEHVKIIALGKCRGCAPGNCDEYESEDPNSYTDCSYCACPANLHTGAEKLIKKKVSAEPVGPAGASVMSGMVLRRDETGNPVQTTNFGLCKYPKCQYPRRIENSHVLDYCSKTCADKARQAILQRAATTTNSSNMPSFSNSVVGQGSSSACPRSVAGHTTNSIMGRANDSTVKGSSPMTSLLSTPGVSTVCSKCQKNPPNKGRKWCESCYISNLKQSRP